MTKNEDSNGAKKLHWLLGLEKETLADMAYQQSKIIEKLLESAKAQAVPEGYTLISTELLDKFPEINTNNYSHDDVDKLNSWGIELVTSVND